VHKTMIALATVATIGLTTAAFANTTSSMKDIRSAQPQASVTYKKHVSHRVGAKKVVVAHNRPLHRPAVHATHYSHHAGKKHVAKHVAAKKTMREKASS